MALRILWMLAALSIIISAIFSSFDESGSTIFRLDAALVAALVGGLFARLIADAAIIGDSCCLCCRQFRATRLHNQILSHVSLVERSSTHQGITVDGVSDVQAAGLEAKGHKLEWVKGENCSVLPFNAEKMVLSNPEHIRGDTLYAGSGVGGRWGAEEGR